MIIRVFLLLVSGLSVSLVGCSQNRPAATSAAAPTATAAADGPAADTSGLAVATFASGCFWCSEEVFEQLEGVHRVVSGYAGGLTANPTYREVTSGTTGHAEAVQIWYNPQVLSYTDLLEVFFASHDPTTLNRQGPDRGTHYRSAVFYRTPTEQQQATAFINKLNQSGTFSQPVVTQLEPFREFYQAEPYHQNYFRLFPNDPYIRSVSKPKVDKVRSQFPDKLKQDRR